MEVDVGSNARCSGTSDSACLNSPKADNKPAPYALVCPCCLHKPNSTVNQYNYNIIICLVVKQGVDEYARDAKCTMYCFVPYLNNGVPQGSVLSPYNTT